jgi:hypothetical protein
VATALRERREIEGIRPSDRRNLESMQRVYIQPLLGKRPIDAVRQSDVERLGRRMLAQQLAPKTVRNLMTVLSSGVRARDRRRMCGHRTGTDRTPRPPPCQIGIASRSLVSFGRD